MYYLYFCEIQKWLRDVHNINILIEFEFSKPKNYGTYISDFGWVEDQQEKIIKFNTYEETLLEGIIKSLELL